MTGRSTRTLRISLKEALRDRHDSLDRALGSWALSDDESYARFLAVQYAARMPVETWARAFCPPDRCPPPQTPLIADDLAGLGRATPETTPLRSVSDAGWQGLAWALGGSSLGNRAMLARRRKAGLPGPSAFLSDPAMPLYFRAVLPVLERPADHATTERSIRAAEAVFDSFAAALAPLRERVAA